jgi:hypothetical protein
MRNDMDATLPPFGEARPSALSPASYKVLDLLHKGCAYSVRGAWRFRGVRSRVKEQAFASLLATGLAERVETDRYAEMRITVAGTLDQRRQRMSASPTSTPVKTCARAR